MLSSNQLPVIMSMENNTATKSLLAKILGLATHIAVLYFGTVLAEYGWRMWSIC
jgi:hypothetical protein